MSTPSVVHHLQRLISGSPLKKAAILVAIVAIAVAAPRVPSAMGFAGSSVISGTVYQDLNRDRIHETSEPILAGQKLNLFDATGQTFVATATSDASGHYQINGLADTDYLLLYDMSQWWSLRNAWVPTTTGSVFPRISVHLVGAALADFGWRAIVRSTTLSAPLSTYLGSNGMRVQSFDDVLNAKMLYDDLMTGSLVGVESSRVTLVFDFYPGANHTDTSAVGSPGSYSGYTAWIYIDLLTYLDELDVPLLHEYGIAWSGYYAYLVQQDDTFTSYLKFRGIYLDPRLDTSRKWDRGELIAEDYRQLFGSSNAKLWPQDNTDIPPAAQVAGLKDFLATTFTGGSASTRTAPAPSPTPTPAAIAAPAPSALAISSLSLTPTPMKSSATVSFLLSAPASVTLTILDANGNLVRTLLSNPSQASGTVTAAWDRKDAYGKRVRSGTYTVWARATDQSGQSAGQSVDFSAN